MLVCVLCLGKVKVPLKQAQVHLHIYLQCFLNVCVHSIFFYFCCCFCMWHQNNVVDDDDSSNSDATKSKPILWLSLTYFSISFYFNFMELSIHLLIQLVRFSLFFSPSFRLMCLNRSLGLCTYALYAIAASFSSTLYIFFIYIVRRTPTMSIRTMHNKHTLNETISCTIYNLKKSRKK